jgi:UDP-N-acetyl-D-galactosamine dehydrogenase
VVSGCDAESLEEIANVYALVVKAGIHKASCIKVAEAAKIIENTQRDLNIALMNELSIIFDMMNINTYEVLDAAATKWNFLKFQPGLVGGHCIGVDPYYLTYKAAEVGYHSQVILAGRRINDDMGRYIAVNTVKKLIQNNRQVKGAKVVILGITFKENCPDSRNTKVIDIIKELSDYGVEIEVVDPVADADEVQKEYGISLYNLDDIKEADAVIVAVAHQEFKALELQDILKLYKPGWQDNCAFSEVAATLSEDVPRGKYVLIDVKSIFSSKQAKDMNYLYWRL